MNTGAEAGTAYNSPKLQEMLKAISQRVGIQTVEIYLSEFKSLCNQVPDGAFVLVTAPSGSGKNWVAAQSGKYFVDLDKFGNESVRDGKTVFTTDIEALRDYTDAVTPRFLSGTSDNMKEVLRAVNSYQADCRFVFVVPQYDLFLQTQAAKARDGKSMGLDPSWISNWESKSKMSRREYGKYFTSKYESFLTLVGEEIDSNLLSVYCLFTEQQGPVTSGWFQHSEDVKIKSKPNQSARS